MGRLPVGSRMAGRFVAAATVAAMLMACTVYGMPAGVVEGNELAAADDNGYAPELVIDAPDSDDLGESAGVIPVSTTPATLLKATVASSVLTAIDETAATTGACGDSKREGSEECDDGNTASNDGCSATCKVEGGYQCLPLEVNGKDMCVACGDKQCTTSFSLQSRCMDTAAALISGPADTTVQNVGGQSTPEDSANPPVDETAKF